MAEQAVDGQLAALPFDQWIVVGQRGAQVDVELQDTRFGQRRHHTVRGGHQFGGGAQADGRAVFAFDLARAHQHVARAARHDVDAVARVQQAHRACQAVAWAVKPDHFAAHAAHSQGIYPLSRWGRVGVRAGRAPIVPRAPHPSPLPRGAREQARADAAHIDHHIERQHAPIGQSQRAATLACFNGQYALTPMPVSASRS